MGLLVGDLGLEERDRIPTGESDTSSCGRYQARHRVSERRFHFHPVSAAEGEDPGRLSGGAVLD
jgi:hypothetical protein